MSENAMDEVVDTLTTMTKWSSLDCCGKEVTALIADWRNLRARVAKLEAALNDLRSNVDYHGHKKLDAALSETVEA